MVLMFGIDNAIFYVYILSFCVALSWAWYFWRPDFSARTPFFCLDTLWALKIKVILNVGKWFAC